MYRRFHFWVAHVMFVVFGVSSTIGQAPEWWTTRGIIDPTAPADDYAAVNQGQLKNLAKAAKLEMEARLIGGAGETITNMVTAWETPTGATDDFAAVTTGQLKATAKPFYDRLMEAGLLAAGTAYPWEGQGLEADDFAVANVGQAKALFAFPITAQDPWVALTAPVNGSYRLAGGNVELKASAGSPEGITKVEFYRGEIKIGEDSTAPYSLTWSSPAAGDYILTAKAVDGTGAVLVSAEVAFAVHNDNDNDGMGDAWEAANGLTASDDPLADKDGDRIPNLWEYARGTPANQATQPVYDAVVDAKHSTNAAMKRYKTLQEAYDSLPTDADYRSLVEVRAGTYDAVLDAVTVRKKVAWIGQGMERSRGYGAAIWQWKNSGSGVKVAEAMVFDRIIIDGGSSGANRPVRPQPALLIDATAGAATKVGMINCVVRHWHTRDATGDTTGSVVILGGQLRLFQTTIFNCAGRNSIDTAWANVIDNRGGAVSGRNNIIWGSQDVTPQPVGLQNSSNAAVNFGGAGTLVQGYSFDPLPNDNPRLTDAGYLQYTLTALGAVDTALSSTEVINQGFALVGFPFDAHGQPRPATGRDIGADEWIDSDADRLPDWWELNWFGNLGQSRTGDPDGDGVQNLAEYYALSVPVTLTDPNDPSSLDSDGDGFTDDEEREYGSDPFDAESHPPVPPPRLPPGQNPDTRDSDGDMLPDGFETQWGFNPNSPGETLLDPDNDGLTNIREWRLHTNPTSADTDGDGMEDGWEVKYELDPLDPADAAADPDEDNLTNLQEHTAGTNPREKDTDGDGMPDDWELANGLDPKSFEDRWSDADGDGFEAWQEYANGTGLAVADPGGPGSGNNNNGNTDETPGPVPGTPGGPAASPASDPPPPTGRIIAFSRTRTAAAKATSHGVLKPEQRGPYTRESKVYLKRTDSVERSIIWYDSKITDGSIPPSSWSIGSAPNTTTYSSSTTDITEDTASFDETYKLSESSVYTNPIVLTPDTVPPQTPITPEESTEERLDQSDITTHDSLYYWERSSTSPSSRGFTSVNRFGLGNKNQTVTGRLNLDVIRNGGGGPIMPIAGSRHVDEGGYTEKHVNQNEWRANNGQWYVYDQNYERDYPAIVVDESMDSRLELAGLIQQNADHPAEDSATKETWISELLKNGKPVGTYEDKLELDEALPWPVVDTRMREHFALQTFPEWDETAKIKRITSGIIGTAIYDCSFNPADFRSEAADLSWYFYYDTEGLTEQQVAALAPIEKPIWKRYKDPQGNLVHIEMATVTLSPGQTSRIYWSRAMDEEKLPDGGTVEISFTTIGATVDVDRDGVIDPQEIASPQKPFRFWLNNDNDSTEDDSEIGLGDSNDTIIKRSRDLEDFLLMRFTLPQEVQTKIALNEWKIGLKFTESENNPSIKVYRAYKGPSVVAHQGYVWDQQLATLLADGQYNATMGTVESGSTLWLPQDALKGEFYHPYLLFEAHSAGKGNLTTVLEINGRIVELQGVWLNLVDIKQMYEGGTHQFVADPDEEHQVLTHVHGWNMSYEGSVVYTETLFKRLWHKGYKGRYAFFRWGTDWSSAFDNVPGLGQAVGAYLADYNGSEFTAWNAGAALKQFVDGHPQGYTRNLIAHSMGNVVAGSALAQGLEVANYAMLHAAIPASCYDASEAVRQATSYTHNIFMDGAPVTVAVWNETTADHQDDPLAYRGKLAGLSANLINFYLKTDHATSFAWEVNNDMTKGPYGPIGVLNGYRYDTAAQPGHRCLKDGSEITDHYKAMAFVAKCWSKSAGAQSDAADSIKDNVDLSGAGIAFGDEHSAEFNRRSQKLSDYFDQLVDRLMLK